MADVTSLSYATIRQYRFPVHDSDEHFNYLSSLLPLRYAPAQVLIYSERVFGYSIFRCVTMTVDPRC